MVARPHELFPSSLRLLAQVARRRDSSFTLRQLSDILTVATEVADDMATGASTALAGSVGSDNRLRVVSLGDCVTLVIRNGRPYTRSKDILHYFDCPFQLGDVSPDRPKDATTLTVQLVEGDVVVSGSDGIFDNISDADIASLVASTPNKSPSNLAKVITDQSRLLSLSESAKVRACEANSFGFGSFLTPPPPPPSPDPLCDRSQEE